ncbi:MAG: GldG family protein, partial [Proteobacteria bacterium]|nr:GldG family protein [Pseudomonadota bacterium]
MADKTAKWRTGGRESLGLASLVVALVLFVAVNILAQAGLKGARLDLTGDKLFTVTEGTRSILAKIDEPVTLRFYFSPSLGKELPGLAKYAARVRDLLGEYTALAGGKIRLEIADPSPFS